MIVLFKGLEYIFSQRGHPLLIVDGFLYRKNRGSYWRCIRCTKYKCRSRLILKRNEPPITIEDHTHGPETEKIAWGRKVLDTIKHEEDVPFQKIKIPARNRHCDVDYYQSDVVDLDVDVDGVSVSDADGCHDKLMSPHVDDNTSFVVNFDEHTENVVVN